MIIYLEKKMNKKILVTGGSGLVGKHLKDILQDAIKSKTFEVY